MDRSVLLRTAHLWGPQDDEVDTLANRQRSGLHSQRENTKCCSGNLRRSNRAKLSGNGKNKNLKTCTPENASRGTGGKIKLAEKH